MAIVLKPETKPFPIGRVYIKKVRELIFKGNVIFTKNVIPPKSGHINGAKFDKMVKLERYLSYEKF